MAFAFSAKANACGKAPGAAKRPQGMSLRGALQGPPASKFIALV